MLSFIQVFFAIFGVMDPVGNTPTFITLTKSLDKKSKRRLAWGAVLYAGVILVVFMFLGNAILNAFHISIGSFRVAGGIILLVLGFQIVFDLEFQKKSDLDGERDISIVPLATPLIAGPGTITSVVILAKQYGFILTLAGIILNLILSYILFMFSDVILKVLGKKGALIFANMMGLILMAIGVEFIKSGVMPT